jgi:hypothetical protein
MYNVAHRERQEEAKAWALSPDLSAVRDLLTVTGRAFAPHRSEALHGDSTYDHPYYLCGHWGKPDGQAEVPEPARGLLKEEAPQIRAFETGRFLFVFDDREGKEALVVKDKTSGDQIEFDGVGMGITIKATSALLLKADAVVSIEGASVQINGRLVLPGPKPI